MINYCMGRPGETFTFDDGTERFKLTGPVLLIRAYIPECLATLTFAYRPDLERLHLLDVKIFSDWRETFKPDAFRGQAVIIRINPWGSTEVAYENEQWFLDLSHMDLLNLQCLGITARPEWSNRKLISWQRKLVKGTGHDAVEAERTAWAAIQDDSHGNPELAARIRNVLDHYHKDVENYRAVGHG